MRRLREDGTNGIGFGVNDSLDRLTVVPKKRNNERHDNSIDKHDQVSPRQLDCASSSSIEKSMRSGGE